MSMIPLEGQLLRIWTRWHNSKWPLRPHVHTSFRLVASRFHQHVPKHHACGIDLTDIPDSKVHLGQYGAHLGPVGPRWAPCWPHEPFYQGWLGANRVVTATISRYHTTLSCGHLRMHHYIFVSWSLKPSISVIWRATRHDTHGFLQSSSFL